MELSRSTKNLKAVAAVEVILATVVISLVTVIVGAAIVRGVNTNYKLENNQRAYQLLEETFAAVDAIREDDYANLTAGSYGLDEVGGVWQLTPGTDITGIITREITIADTAAETKTVTLDLSWLDRANQPQFISVDKVYTNWQRTIGLPGGWQIPLVGSTFNLSGSLNAFAGALQDNELFVGRQSGNPEFAGIDVTDPTNLSQINTENMAGNFVDVAVNGDYVYLASTNNNEEFQIVEIDNPNNYQSRDSINLTGGTNANAVAVINDDYVALGRANNNSQPEFNIIDVSNPNNINIAYQFDLGSSILDMKVDGNYIYIATNNGSQELYVGDITNPTSPSLINTTDVAGNGASDLVIAGTNLYIAMGNNTLVKYDITNPNSPTFEYSITISNTIRGLDTNGSDLIFVATQDNSADFQVIQDSGTALSLYGSVNTRRFNDVVYDPINDVVYGLGNNNNEEIIVIEPTP